MCANYLPVRERDLAVFGRGQANFQYLDECFPGGSAPFLASFDATLWLDGVFGLLPSWAETKLARQTYNARAETVAVRPSYRGAWAKRQFAVIPVQAFFEPCYASGRPERWRIERRDGRPFGLAGIWERRHHDGKWQWSFSMLTINADQHPLMRRFHKPAEEKRSVVVLNDADWDDWLHARTDANARAQLLPFDAELMHAVADPMKKRQQAAPTTSTPQTGMLFDE